MPAPRPRQCPVTPGAKFQNPRCLRRRVFISRRLRHCSPAPPNLFDAFGAVSFSSVSTALFVHFPVICD
eukprot:gene13965-biopygen12603